MNLQEISLFLDAPIFVVPDYDTSISALLTNSQAEILFFFASQTDANTLNSQNQKVLDSMLNAIAAKQKNEPFIKDLEKDILILPEKKHIQWDFERTQVKYLLVFGENTAQNIGLPIEKYVWQKWKDIRVLFAHSLQEIEAQKNYKNLIWQAMLQIFQ